MDQAYKFKITLQESKPVIWRRVLIPEYATFEELHCVINTMFGWEDYSHMYEFDFKDFIIGLPQATSYSTVPIGNLNRTRLFDIFPDYYRKCVYTFDFGDEWCHTVAFEGAVDMAEGKHYPVCVSGRMNAPPEDCGGIYGYYRLVQIINDKSHPDHGDKVEWLGTEEFDIAYFDFDNINEALAKFNFKKTKMRPDPKVLNAILSSTPPNSKLDRHDIWRFLKEP